LAIVVGPRPTSLPPVALADIAEAVGAVIAAAGDPAVSTSIDVTGVCLDSRRVLPGDLYAALPGTLTHGAKFLAGAIDRGAVAVLTDDAGERLAREAGIAIPMVVVADPRSVLGVVSARVYATAPAGLALVGITGTNGKTTTAYLLDGALRALGRRTGLIGTVETRVADEVIKSSRTTPEAPDLHALLATMRERDVDTCVMEVSSHALTLHRVDGVVYDVAVFTNLSQDHLDMHGTMDDYFAAKASLFTPERARRAVVCIDDDWGRRLAAQSEIPVVMVGMEPTADYVLSSTLDQSFTLVGVNVNLTLRSALPGSFNKTNTALAAVTLLELGYPSADVERAVLTAPHVPGRMERVAPPDSAGLVGVVDYAHTPEAVSAALAALRPQSRHLVVVLGAGGDRDQGKRAAMGSAAAAGADIVIVTDDNPRSEDPATIRAALLEGAGSVAGSARILEVADRRDAIAAAVTEAGALGPGAVIAVVGKGHETGQEVAGVIEPFDDRVELRSALQAYAAGSPS
jgi:UDP-N-acetylmuramoyl-L-alanyl-D-glutamate--2,6-diaminopimelate ligase